MSKTGAARVKADLINGVMGIGQLLPRWLDAPDFTCVLADRAIAGELAAAGDVVDGHFKPL